MEATRRSFLKGIGMTAALGVAIVSDLPGITGVAQADSKKENADNRKLGGEAATRVIFPCSGAADVGEIADRTGRRLDKEGFGRMLCIAAIGASVEAIIGAAKKAKEVIAIDACPLACASKCLARRGFEPRVVALADLGFIKGKSPADSANLEEAYSKIKGALLGEPGAD